MVDSKSESLEIREALFAMSLFLQQQLEEGVTDLVEVIYDISSEPRRPESTRDPGSWGDWKAIFERVRREGVSEDGWLPSSWEAYTWEAPTRPGGTNES